MKMQAQARGEGNGQTLVPALASATPYSSRLSARSALYTDLSLLLGTADRLLPSDEYRVLVLEENCLARASTSSRRKIWKELKSRYILDAGHPLFAGFWTEWTKSVSEQERGLTAYCLLALNDRLVADLSTELLFPLLRRAPAALAVGDVQAFLERAARAHPEVGDWSEQTKKALAQKYAASIRDFGLAKGMVRKTTIRPALYGAPVRLLVRALRLAGVSEMEIVRAPIFRLLALEGPEIIDAFGELNRQGALRFRIQGDVIELNIEGG
jgi:hypothetical protein